MPIQSLPAAVDVLVVGGGPTSLITTYILVKNGVKVLTVEQLERAEQALRGRACVMYSRSVELLDMNGLYECMADTGFIMRGAVTISDGKVVPGRGWHSVQDGIEGKTLFDFCFTIRQKYVEEAVGNAIKDMDPNVYQSPVKLIDYSVDRSSPYPITAKLQLQGGRLVQVRCKYLVGADGGRSTVRALSKIPFPGTRAPHKWVRLDAVVKTDMPCSRKVAAAIESKQHGNVLWLPIDNGRTRIGFVCKNELYGVDGSGVTGEVIMEEAKKALLPNSLEFVQLDWWTVYAFGQRLAEKYIDGHVILAGDAAHTHSSGSAQGMNTGIHDATNLAWKLAGFIKGWYTEDVLDTYASERRASAQRLIELDRDVAALISGKIPDHFHAPPDADANAYLDVVLNESAEFTTGLGISYTENLLNRTNPSPTNLAANMNLIVGRRAPDAPLFRHGRALPQRLQELAASSGRRFSILVFAGEVQPAGDSVRLNSQCGTKYRGLRQYMDSAGSFTRALADVFQILTILRGKGTLQPSETLGALPLGKAVYDYSGEAYTKYAVEPGEGAIVVLRPDGIVGFAAALNGWGAVASYFKSFVRPAVRGDLDGTEREAPHTVGEFAVEGSDESMEFARL